MFMNDKLFLNVYSIVNMTFSLRRGNQQMKKLGIVVIGYKNAVGMERLLSSIKRVDFCGDTDITLIASVDYSGDDSVEKLVNAFEWQHGKKFVNAYRENLGLRKHILLCGGYMEKYNLDAIAVFEDDIYVSPQMYRYMKAAVDFYSADEKIAGISLYKHELNSYAKHPFIEYYDGGDTFFIQYAQSWGQIWLREQWNSFIQWYEAEQWKTLTDVEVPTNVLNWKNSWLKFHIMYCISQDKYFVYPRVALTTNFTDVGAHNVASTKNMHVRMSQKRSSEWVFNTLSSTKAVYDAFFENVNLRTIDGHEDVVVDLYGAKKYPKDAQYVLTRKNLPYEIEKSWGLNFRPIEENIFLDLPGDELFLYNLSKPAKVRKNKQLALLQFEYDVKGLNVLNIEILMYVVKQFIIAVKFKLRKMKKR